MVQSNKQGRFEAPAPAAQRQRPINWGAPIKELKSTTSAPLRPITGPERDILSLLTVLAQPILGNGQLNSFLAELKGHLFNKNYQLAFGGKEEYRQAYAARWVPSRALIYRKIMRESLEIKSLLCSGSEDSIRTIICLGGGAGSEVVALGSLISKWTTTAIGSSIKVVAVDNCDWSGVIQGQDEGMREAWPTLEGRFSVDFVLADCLHLPPPTVVEIELPSQGGALAAVKRSSPEAAELPPHQEPTSISTTTLVVPAIIDYSNASLITLLFTISELFLQSRAKTVAMLNHITATTSPSTLLLIGESASLSDIPLGTTGRTYSLGTMLDYTLCDDKSRTHLAGWEKIREEESTWYRMPEDAATCYPLKLENTRVSIRLFRRITQHVV